MIHIKTKHDALLLASLPGPDTTTKKDALLCDDTRLKAMLKVAALTGWPKAFQNDLYQHDVAILAAHPGKPMLWILRDNGTHLFPIEAETEGQATYARTVIRYWSGDYKLNVIENPQELPHFYLVTHDGLERLKALEAASKIHCRNTETHEGSS